MKRHISILIITLSFGFFGCENQLSEEPKTFLSPDQFFTSEDECIQAVNGVYERLPELFGSNNFWNVVEMGCDDIIRKGLSDVNENYQYLPSNSGGAATVWNLGYTIIMRANQVISRLQDAPIDDELKLRLTGEAKFIRGLQFYILANTFGDVPLWTEELDIDEISNLPRAPLKEVRKQLVQDLTDAANALPNRFTGADAGRANKAAALTLLAKEYLIEQNWAAAKTAAQAVAQMPEYELLADYSELLDYKTRNSKESIFEIQYLRNPATEQNFVDNRRYTYFMPPSDAPGVFAGVDFGAPNLRSYANFYPSEKFVSLFEDEDQRKDVVLAYGFNGQLFDRMAENGMPFFGPKFWDLDANDMHSGRNLMFLRLADVYMILAEAENETGNIIAAHQWINKIRTRAGVAALGNLSQQQMREAIMKENAVEFCGEFKRKWDLIRWGKLIEAVKSVAEDNPLGAENIQPYHFVYPISEDEIIKNDALIQNPGYPE